MKRSKMRVSKDKKVFKHSADKTKKVNIAPVVARGGFRL